MKSVLLLASALALLWAGPIAGQLDLASTFGVDGRVALPGEGPNDERIVDLRVDDAERITFVFNGFGSPGLGRLLADGSLDPDFGSDGLVFLDFTPAAITIQPDGGIVVGGAAPGASSEPTWQLARFFPDGSMDTGFGDNGELEFVWFGGNDQINALAVAANGDIVVAGRAFDPAAGSGLAVAIFNASGQLQQQRFTKVVAGNADWCSDVLVQSDGRIVCVGLTRNFNLARMIALRYESNLDIDTSFGVNGLALVDTTAEEMEAHSGALTAAGQIVLGGWVDRGAAGLNLAIVRLASDGSVDTGFGADGLVETSLVADSSDVVEDLMVLGTDLLVAASSQDMGDYVVLRYDVNGDPVSAFGSAGQVQIDFNGLVDQARVLALHQGQVLVGGGVIAAQRSELSNLGLLRLQTDGSPDPAFANAGLLEIGLTGPVRTVVQDAAGRAGGGIVAAFWTGSSFSARDFSFFGVQADGEPDPDFGTAGLVRFDFDNDEDTVEAVAVQPDGRILAAGATRPEQSTQGTDFGILRLMPDGAVDAGFGSDGAVTLDLDGGTDVARALHVLDDGRMLIAGEGQFFNSGGNGDLVVVRLLADGSLDTSFGNAGIARADSGATFEFAAAITVLADDRIIVGGSANSDFVLAAFNADGSTASGFGNNGIVTLDFAGEFDAISALLTVPDWNGQGERIVAAGSARTGSSVLTTDFAAAMFTTAGQLENGFGDAGKAIFDISAGQIDEATDAVQWQGTLVLAGVAAAAGGQNGDDYAIIGLDSNGQPLADFTVDGASRTVDFLGSADEACAIVADAGDLTLVGTVIDPLLPSFISQLTGLARLNDAEVLFMDSFEGP